MRSLMIFMSFMIMTSAFGQVKEQYRDTSNTSTIIVVKNDETVDQDVLDDYFDLNNMSMNDEIMITTAPDVENSTAELNGVPSIENDNFKIVDINVDETKEAVRKPITVNKNSARSKAKGSYQVKSRMDVMKASQKKYFKGKRKNKKKKRKNKRSSSGCYGF